MQLEIKGRSKCNRFCYLKTINKTKQLFYLVVVLAECFADLIVRCDVVAGDDAPAVVAAALVADAGQEKEQARRSTRPLTPHWPHAAVEVAAVVVQQQLADAAAAVVVVVVVVVVGVAAAVACTVVVVASAAAVVVVVVVVDASWPGWRRVDSVDAAALVAVAFESSESAVVVVVEWVIAFELVVAVAAAVAVAFASLAWASL